MAAFDEVATAIITGQKQVIGPVAIALARKVDGLDVTDDGTATIRGDGVKAIESLVREYSALTGQLGVRMCFNAAQPALRQHPSVEIPSFATL